MLPTLLCLLAGFFLIVHFATLVIAGWRCRPRKPSTRADRPRPPVTVVRPLCGLENFTASTLEAAFGLDYPTYELLFCVADANDPVLPLVHAAVAAHPAVPARVLVGDDRIGFNPKLNNMVKGWREAAFDYVAFIDSNVLVPPDFIDRLVDAFVPGTGAVSAPPCGTAPDGFAALLECAFLNTFEARWQYCVDTVGQGFAQGKTLLYRKADLDRNGMRDLATEPAEDAATTKMVRSQGLRVRLAPPSPQPLGRRKLAEVWQRQLRWARMRRATFPREFYPEILAGAFVPSLVTAMALLVSGWSGVLAPAMIAFWVVWFGAELALAAACRWPGGWRMPFALALRDALVVALWIGAFSGRSFTWKGNALQMEAPRASRAPAAAPGALGTEQEA